MAFLHSTLIFRRLLSRSAAHICRMSTSSTSVIPSKIQNSSSPSPWLMLPPTFDNNTTSVHYNFYSLADNIIITRPQVKELKNFMPEPIHHLTFCGSSQGWIAMFNPHTLDVFIYDPISLRHIKLPPIHNLPNSPKDNKRLVHKVILSISPDDDGQCSSCRAVMIYNCSHGMAVCCPGHSDEWTQVGIFPTTDANGIRVGNCYNDIVYSTRQNMFFALTDHSDIETWDLSDLSSPVLLKMIKTDDEKYVDQSEPCLYEELAVQPGPMESLVVVDDLFNDDQDDVLLVTRYAIAEVAPDGSFIDYDYPPDYCSRILDPSVYPIMRKPSGLYPPVKKLSDFFFYPQVTIGFYIDLYDQKEDDIHPGLPSLGDMTLFMGSCSDSVALPATRFPELKSNSIYFTDQYMENGDGDESFSGHDIGIFDFENETVSPCYYPCDRPNMKTVVPSPIWFFPRLP